MERYGLYAISYDVCYSPDNANQSCIKCYVERRTPRVLLVKLYDRRVPLLSTDFILAGSIGSKVEQM